MSFTLFKRILAVFFIAILVGVYYYPAPKIDFFKLYTHNDYNSQSLKEFQSRKTNKIIVDDVQWTYYSGGNGRKTILFLHGMGGSYDIWWQQVLEFEKEYKVITYTLPEKINSLENVAKGINAILEKENIDKFTVVGTSMGGYIAQYLVNTIPEKIDKVVFGNTFPPNKIISKENEKTAKIIPLLPEILIMRLGIRKLNKEIVPAAKDSELLHAFFQSIPFSKKQFINRYAVVIDTFTVNTLRSKHIPKLIFESDNDPLVKEELRTAIKYLHKDAETYTFHNAGHFPYVNEANEYNRVLQIFLNE